MVLPSGVNKAAGLKRALKHLGIRAGDVVAVGDAENDHALFDYCGYSAAVANALASVKEHARWGLQGTDRAGVSELIDLIMASDEKRI